MRESLQAFIERSDKDGVSREKIIRRAEQRGWKKATVASDVARYFARQGKRQRSRRSDAGQPRLVLSPEEQKIFRDFESQHGDRTRQLLQKLIRHAVRIEFPLTLGEIEDSPKYPEGAKTRLIVNAYERNEKAIAACIKHYGVKCCICRMTFEDTYGVKAKDFIQVHHLVPLAKVGRAYNVNPITDLRPVCPNCHAVIHMRKDVPFTPEEVREMLAS